ncbi:MAG: hypothetical protein JRJ42_04945 [Deltaproteobacteria bacterium]|nr:hypothetical protein [Deltaproteobacteria bacterium]MBW2019753.1 hypothetical protein [Deltaproteobacteria bacterium]MBW2074579.1 hypothetical protein [Deltaproteobacteria bacterium]RLB83437.1 MAG: hypothetical protein DRH17_02135 [Deltaproteobacteria bacterium]
MQSTDLQLLDKDTQISYSGIKPVWQIDIPFKCPVIGACLTERELKNILKKTGICIKYLNAYQLHRIVMENGKHGSWKSKSIT